MNTNTETITPVIEPVPASLVRARYPTAAGIGGTALLIAKAIAERLARDLACEAMDPVVG